MKRMCLAALTGAFAISGMALAIDDASAAYRGGGYRGGIGRVGVGRVGVGRVGPSGFRCVLPGLSRAFERSTVLCGPHHMPHHIADLVGVDLCTGHRLMPLPRSGLLG